MPLVLEINCNEAEQARLDLMPGLLRDPRGWTSPSYNQDLGTLLRKFGHSKASDSRDIIYALLGLCEDAYTSDILRPNYEISLQEVIQNTIAYLLTSSRDLHKDSYTGVLPTCNLTEFLHALQDLPTHTFFWAMQHCEDELLADLLDCQLEKKNDFTLREYTTYRGIHGPLITVSIKKANLDLFNKCLQVPGVDVISDDKDGYTPLLAARKQRDEIFEHVLLETFGSDYVEVKYRHIMVLPDALKLGIWAVAILWMLGSLWAAHYLCKWMWLMRWSRRVKRRWT